MLRFRPYPGMTIACAILFAVLCGLGVWQIQRLHWKLALIATVNGHLADPPLPLDKLLRMDIDTAQYRRVALLGHFDNDHESYVFTTDSYGDAVYHVLTPFQTVDGRILMVDRGMVPKELLAPATRAAGNIQGQTKLVGVWRTPDAPGFFTPSADIAHRIWYARDLTGIAATDHLSLAAPVVVEADATPNPGGWPKGGQTVVAFRNQHLSYAVTWFGLAVGLLGIWLSYHISKGRLVWARRASYKPGPKG